MKNLTILVLTAALLPACIITTDGTSETDTNGTSNATTGGASNDTTGGTTGGTTDSGTTAGGSESATESGTTEAPPTTGETTTSEVTTSGTTAEATTSGTTGGGVDYGMCGWHPEKLFYGCAASGAEPGTSDPEGMDAIGCPEGVVEGAACGDLVTNIGCCAAGGDNFYCDADIIVKEACGA
jgi:hypothetical protein